MEKDATNSFQRPLLERLLKAQTCNLETVYSGIPDFWGCADLSTMNPYYLWSLVTAMQALTPQIL